MSNLWFFRLKRAEQQRRRSSGEQSVGSASIQSASGCCSASGHNPSGLAPTSSLSALEKSPACGVVGGASPASTNSAVAACPHHNHACPHHHAHRRHRASYHEFYGQQDEEEEGEGEQQLGRDNGADLRGARVQEEEKEEEEPREPKDDERRAASTTSGRREEAPPEVGQTSEWVRAPEVASQRRGRMSSGGGESSPAAPGSAGSRGQTSMGGNANQLSRPQLPQVTIIRSDSTSSSFISMGHTLESAYRAAAAAASAELSSGERRDKGGAQRPQPPTLRKRELVSKLMSETSGLVETNVNSPARSGEVRAAVNDFGLAQPATPAGEQTSGGQLAARAAPLGVPAESQQQQQQQLRRSGGQASSGGNTETSLGEAESACESSSALSHHLLHDQLSSGQVPPIHEKNLLNPNSSGPGGGLPMADSMDNLAALIPRIRVEFYNSENTLKEKLQLYFIKDHTVSLYVRSAKLTLKFLACYLYVCRVILDRGPAFANCYGCQPVNSAQANNLTFASLPASLQSALNSSLGVGGPGGGTSQQTLNNLDPALASLITSVCQQQQVQQPQLQSSGSKFDSHPYDGPYNYRALFWVDRGQDMWFLQTTIAVICFTEAILMQYLTYKNNIFSIISFHFILEILTNTPFIMSISWTQLRTVFVPGFLNCWLAKQCLEAMLNDISIVRQTSVFSHRLTILSATVFCLIFTSACGFQHAQRIGGRNISIFESIYFVVVTFSTVGYGDFKPETWPSQLFIMVMICVALVVLPTQFEQLAYFWFERKKLGASYAHHSTRHEKHVVVCSTTLRADTIMDFLNEFYAHPLLQTFSVVLLSPCELDTTMKLVLQTPTWNNRVVYIQGSALKANDLIRARMQSAEACFILAARNYNDRSAADEHTILRSWAIRDFSPYVPQYVQIFRTENKIHVAFAEHVVCDDEFKYALLANNCLIPGTSTLVTLLLHTSQRQTRRARRAGRRRRRQARRACGQVRRCCGGLIGGVRQQLARPLNWWRNLDTEGEAASTDGIDWRAKINAQGQALSGDDFGPDGSSKWDQEGGLAAKDEKLGGDPSKQHDTKVGQGEKDDEDEDDDDDDDDYSQPEWKRLYGKCSANEIYHIRLSDSRFFGEYQGKSFTYASFHSHRKFGVALIGVQTDMRGTWPIMLNPGPTYSLKPSDILFYINITKEENSALMPMMQQNPSSSASVLGHLLDRNQPDGGGGGGGAGSGEQLQTPAPGGGLSSAELPSMSTTGQPEEADEPSRNQHSTSIRIEASSPTTAGGPHGPLGPPVMEHLAPDVGPGPAPAKPVVKKHSVADGAGMVARSLCSVAGIPMGGLDSLVAPSCDSPPNSSQTLHPSKRKHFMDGQHHLGKRNSTASTSAAMMGGCSSSGAPGLSVAPGYGSRNASTLELAAIATGLRKGSNISISSTRSRDASPTRLKQVVSGLAVKMKRVKLGKSLTHLTIPRMDLGGGASVSSTESFVNARGRRPSIAPVPAMMGESEEHDSDHEREQESYFSMSWQSSSESSPIVKKFVFCTTYVGVSPTLCYLLQRKKLPCCLQLIQACEHCPFKNARQYNWPNRCIILASDFASNGIYNFLVPLRAHFHNPNELRPIVLLLERKPSPQFIDAISWFPMVYWMPGSIDNLDDLIKAGINLAHSVVVTNKESTNSAEEDYLADCNTIVAVQTMFKMFPSVGIITELSQSSNMRFMQFRAHDLLFGSLTLAAAASTSAGGSSGHRAHQSSGMNTPFDSGSGGGGAGGEAGSCSESLQTNNLIRDRIHLRKLHSQYTMGRMRGSGAGGSRSAGGSNGDINSHAYKYRLPFAAGNVFSASMLDTLLYQAFVKDYMITMVRLLLGIDQAPGSGFLSSMRITKGDLWIRTYGRLYQRLCSTTCEIPLGIYRTEPLEKNSPPGFATASGKGQQASYSFGAFVSQQASYEQATEELERIEISNMVKNRLQDLGMNVNDYDDSMTNRNNTFSYVIINPNCDVPLREGDIVYLIRPSPIHSRKLFMHRANSVRYVDQSVHPRQQPHHHNQTFQSQSPREQRRVEMNLPTHLNEVSNQVDRPDGLSAAAQHGSNLQHDPGFMAEDQAKFPIESSMLKTYFSDGDFTEVLIKVNDHEHSTSVDGQRSSGEPNSMEGRQVQQRRRSSCSDADDSKRSSLSHE